MLRKKNVVLHRHKTYKFKFDSTQKEMYLMYYCISIYVSRFNNSIEFY